MQVQDDTKTINYRANYQTGWAVAQDVTERAERAMALYPDFFRDPDHLARVELTREVLLAFFEVHGGIYENQRMGNRKPFTALKVQRPHFPNHLSKAEREERYHAPLRELGVEIIFSSGTNSYIYRVK